MWITSSGKYPERAKSLELTEEVKKEASKLLNLVNNLLKDLGIPSARVSSGFRPSSVNSKLPNAAKRSLHMTGKAIDLEDPNNSLDALISSKTELLDKYGLWLELPDETLKWCHLDNGTRPQRKVRIFNP
jgi:hypothetical protein